MKPKPRLSLVSLLSSLLVAALAAELRFRFKGKGSLFLVGFGVLAAAAFLFVPSVSVASSPQPVPVDISPSLVPLLLTEHADTLEQFIETSITTSETLQDWLQSNLNQKFGFAVNLLKILGVELIILLPVLMGLLVFIIRRSRFQAIQTEVQEHVRNAHLQITQNLTHLHNQSHDLKTDLDHLKLELLYRSPQITLDAVTTSQLNSTIANLNSAPPRLELPESIDPDACPNIEPQAELQSSLSPETTPTLESSLEPSESATSCIRKGNFLFLRHCYTDAIAWYEKAIELDSQSHLAWFSKGFALAQLYQYAEALTAYDRTIELKPDYHLAWYNRGKVLEDSQQFGEALASYQKALELKPNASKASL
jgi:tetratricopeptide (TPR) repeat protein